MFQILIAEDDKNTRKLMEAVLKCNGFNLIPASSGEEALKLLDRHHIDLAVLDIMMPGMDGIEAVKAIRGLDREDAGTIPIFAMTAQASSENVRKCLNAGMDGHIPKPIEASKLGSTILKVKVHRN